jgi:CHASE3 domain sensor protein
MNDYRDAVRKVIEQEMKTAIDEEMRKAAEELLEERRKAIKQVLEEQRQAREESRLGAARRAENIIIETWPEIIAGS